MAQPAQDGLLREMTGLEPFELALALQRNSRAYMAVRGAVAEQHLERVLVGLKEKGELHAFNAAETDFDKDFRVQRTLNTPQLVLECKNAEAFKITTLRAKRELLLALASQPAVCTNLFMAAEVHSLEELQARLEVMRGAELGGLLRTVPRSLVHSGMSRFRFSRDRLKYPAIDLAPDLSSFLEQFVNSRVTIDFQRTRNSKDPFQAAEAAEDAKRRFYKTGEIHLVAVCLFARTMRWEFLYSSVHPFKKTLLGNRYTNAVKVEGNTWHSSLPPAIVDAEQALAAGVF